MSSMKIILVAVGLLGVLGLNGCIGCGGASDGCILSDGGLGPCSDDQPTDDAGVAPDAGARDGGSEDADGGSIT
jgi:hypothetical protein